jgi:broad specificity phosphatase PhoE
MPKEKRVIFVRHGQSTANAGGWSDDFAAIPLTELGHSQAAALAKRWDFTPGRIIVSPYLRTHQTAAPTIKRFADVPVETWDVHEFTYWDMANWKGSRPEEQPAEVEHFWTECDPEYRKGPRAETFAELLTRSNEALRRLESLEVDAPVVVFTHGHFIQAMRHTVLFPEWTAAEKMRNFRAFDAERWVANTECVAAVFDGAAWRLE